MTRRTVQVTLPQDLDAAVAAAVARGEYASADDVIAEAVAEWQAGRLIDSETLRRLWLEGLESGAGRNLSIDEIKDEGRRRLGRE